MKSSDIKGIGALIVLGGIITAFSWLYRTIGLYGIIFLVILVIAGIVFWTQNQSKERQRVFLQTVLLFLHTRLTPDATKPYSKLYAKTDFNRWSLLRALQIMRDSIDIALSSKKRDTAQSRMDLAEKQYRQIRKDYSTLIPEEIMNEISETINIAKQTYKTQLFLNVSKGFIEKAGTLKTDKSKLKYLDMALETIDEGIKKKEGDLTRFSKLKDEIIAEQEHLTKA